MTDKKLEEIFEYNLREGRYLAVGQPLVIDTKEPRDREDEESKFQECLTRFIGTISIPSDAEFFVRGHSRTFAMICEDEGRHKYIRRDYTPVQFYKTAKFNVSVS